MTKKSTYFLAGIFLITISLFFTVSDVMADSAKMTTLDSCSANNVMAELNDLLADDASSEGIIYEESEDEEVVIDEPGEETEDVDEGSDDEMEEDEGGNFPDYETDEDQEQDF